jgi:hypothetical protein
MKTKLGMKSKESKGIYDAGAARDGQFQLALRRRRVRRRRVS